MENDIAIKIHYLKVLIEIQLYQQVKILNENSKIKDSKQLRNEQEKIIKDFIESLPENLKSLKNCKQIVYSTLEEVDNKVKKFKEMDDSEER